MSTKKQFKEVIRNTEYCSCNLCCVTCNCTCLDATLHNTVCKHIHLLCLLDPSATQPAEQEIYQPENNQDVDQATHFSQDTVSTSTGSQQHADLMSQPSLISGKQSSITKEKILSKIDKLKELVTKS